MIPVQFIAAGAIAAVSFGAAWTYQGARYEKEIADQRAEQLALLAEAQASARLETERMAKAKADAERNHQVRLSAMARDLAATRNVANGLRDDLSTARSAMPTASCDSLREYGIAASVVVGECSARLVEVAEQADRATGEVMLLKDAWPKKD